MRWTVILVIVGVGLSGCASDTVPPQDETASDPAGLLLELQLPGDAEPEAIDATLAIIRMRLTGVAQDATVEFDRSDDGAVTINVTGFSDSERAISLISARGEVSFRPVIEWYAGTTNPMVGTDTPNIDPDTGLTVEDDATIESWLLYESAFGQQVLRVGPARLEGTDIEGAVPHLDSESGIWAVTVAMSPEGADEFAEMTGEAATYPMGDPRRQIAIVLDGVVISAPVVSADVAPDVGIIGGMALIMMGDVENAQDVAQDLASVIRNGSLPTTFEVTTLE